MAVAYDERPARAIQPFHAVLLAATIPLFLGGLLSDIAYTSTYQIQWSNFASWLIAGGVAFTGFALLWAFIDLIRADRRRGGLSSTFSCCLPLSGSASSTRSSMRATLGERCRKDSSFRRSLPCSPFWRLGLASPAFAWEG